MTTAPVCGATGLGTLQGYAPDCKQIVSSLSALGAKGTICEAQANDRDAQGCTNMAHEGTCAGNICGNASSGISCTAAANYISTIVNVYTDSSNAVHGTVTTAENPLLYIVVQHS